MKKLLLLAACVLLADTFQAANAQTTTIYADEDTYRARAYFFNPGFGWNYQGIFPFEITDGAGGGNVDASINGSTSDESYWRTIIQFNLDGIDEEVDSAVFRLYMTQAQSLNPIGSPPDFDVNVYGSADNRSDSLPYDDPFAEDEWDNSVGINTNYTLIEAGFIVPEDEAGEHYELDVTDFINDRIGDMQTSGNSWVFIRIQGSYYSPSNAWSDGVNTNYHFATPYSSDEFKPALVLTESQAEEDITLEIQDQEGWRGMSSPVSNLNYGELLNDIWTQGFTGSDHSEGSSNVRIYAEGNGDINARGFESIGSAGESPTAGQGFAVFVYEDDAPLEDGVIGGFPKNLTINGFPNQGAVDMPVSLTESEGGYVETADGWNLVGNPYPFDIDWDSGAGWTKDNVDGVIYIYDPVTSDYLSWNGTTGTLTDGKIAAWQGFWIKANNDGVPSLSVNEGAETTGAEFYNFDDVSTIHFEIQQQDKSSAAVMQFHPEADFGHDRWSAFQLASLSDSDFLTLYTRLQGNPGMDIQSVPLELTDPVEYELGIDAYDMTSEMTLNWNAESIPHNLNVELMNRADGTVINLRDQESYTFQPSGEELKRFEPDRQAMVIPALKSNDDMVSQLAIRIIPGEATDIGGSYDQPQQVALMQNYPNPFNPVTVIEYQLQEAGDVTLEVFNMLGQQVAVLVNERVSAGSHQVNFDASNLTSGVYIYRLNAGGQVINRKMTLVK